ncbi:MAG: rod shape-determining protein MreC [Oscillospiraceae bacterium]|nr:rod shape-determining protein MreC [Oscillospiraceae bacterium]
MNLRAFFRSTKFRVLLCVLALLTGVLLYSVKQGGQTDVFSRALQTAVQPVRRFSSSISDSVNRRLDTYFKSKAYRDENARLRDRVAELNGQLIGYDDAVQELNALRDQLKIKERTPDFVLSEPCRVRMPVTNDMTGSFQIDRGEEDGILLNAPVIDSHGLVGVVTAVSAESATVTTILSPELSVGVTVLETGEDGIVEGNLKYAADGKTKLIYLDKDSKVREGNLVITAGTTGLFPYGLPVGNVAETGIEESGLTAYAAVIPAVDLTSLEAVSVLLDFQGRGVARP